ncbi:hypothetical protein FsymDg_1838 [Candidatus Protofrankia datiscae]|uniref:Uncharacterized protein n=2 Tax=Frankiaceae TaxID=74712 RepID=F8B6I3_9ACTN|nr:hypothetical protein FsymDg_1838 [Candidatus Protofrankia datiscae]
MAELWALLPAVDAQAAYQRLDALARQAVDSPDETRGMGARRADAFVDLLLGRDRGSDVTIEVGVLVSAAALAGDGHSTSSEQGTRRISISRPRNNRLKDGRPRNGRLHNRKIRNSNISDSRHGDRWERCEKKEQQPRSGHEQNRTGQRSRYRPAALLRSSCRRFPEAAWKP